MGSEMCIRDSNRPGVATFGEITPFDENSNFDLTSSNNILYKFNSVNGGVICPRGVSVVGSDLRRTKIVPKYVPYPTTQASLGTPLLTNRLRLLYSD